MYTHSLPVYFQAGQYHSQRQSFIKRKPAKCAYLLLWRYFAAYFAGLSNAAVPGSLAFCRLLLQNHFKRKYPKPKMYRKNQQ